MHSQQRPQLIGGSLTRQSEGRFSIHSKQPTVDEDLASMGVRTNSNAPADIYQPMEFVDYNQYFHENSSANGGQPIGQFNTSSPEPTLERVSASSSTGNFPLANLNQNYLRANNEHSQST